MFNRTNRTLTANTLGLDLGTRTLALVAGVNNVVVKPTLRIRYAHSQQRIDHAMRIGDRDRDAYAIMCAPPMPVSPSSSAASAWSFTDWTGGPKARVVAETSPSKPVAVPVHGKRASTGGLRRDRRQERLAASARATSALAAGLTAAGG